MRTGVVLSDETGCILYVSAAIEAILGYASDELIRDTGRKLMHPDDVGRQRDAHVDLLSRPGASRIALARYLHKDRTYRWIEARVTNLLEAPAVGAILSEFRDVTEHENGKDLLVAAQHPPSTVEASTSARRPLCLEPWLTHILEHARALEAELTASKTRTPAAMHLLTEVVEAVHSIRCANRDVGGGTSDVPRSHG